MDEAPPRYDNESTDPAATSELGILQTQVIALQQQVNSLLEAQRDLLLKHRIVDDPPMFNGKSGFREWYWKMAGKVEEIQSLDEKTKVNYIVSRLTEGAFLTVENYVWPRLYPNRNLTYSVVETADELMRLLKKKYA